MKKRGKLIGLVKVYENETIIKTKNMSNKEFVSRLIILFKIAHEKELIK